MYLSRITLDLGGKPALRDLQDSQSLHRTVMSGFPTDGPSGTARAAFGVLYRVDWDSARSRANLLVQSAVAPDWSRLPAGFAAGEPTVKPVDAHFAALATGRSLRFRLRANPTRKIGSASKSGREEGAHNNGKRVPLRRDEHDAWLARKAEEAGFRLLRLESKGDLATAGKEAGGFRRENGVTHRLTHRGVLFEGELVVEDVERFRAAVRAGIGPAKAYGFGLLSLAPTEG